MSRTENLTVMFTDIVNFTERTSRQSRAATHAMLREHDRLLLPLIARFGGRRVKSIGDALLVTFRSPTDAVRCAMAMQDALAARNANLPEDGQIHIRVALNVGEVRVDRKDVLGEAVNVASRVEHLTPPDQIYFTEAVYLAMNKAEVPSAVIGIRDLRGIPEPVKLYQVPPRKLSRLVPGGEELGDHPGELPFGGMHHRQPPATGVGTLLVALRVSGWKRWLAHPALGDLMKTPPRARLVPLAAALTLTTALAAWLDSDYALALFDQSSTPALADAVVPGAAGARSGATAPAIDPDALAWLQRGHRAFEANQRLEAAEAYGKALAGAPGLQDDALLAKRLVACLSWGSEVAIPVIRAHPSPAVVDALSQRTADLGTRAAARAADLLAAMDRADRIDPLLTTTQELVRADTCEDKRAAIRRLHALGDPRALPALRESMGSGVRGWFRSSCFRGDARAAIEALERSPDPAG